MKRYESCILCIRLLSIALAVLLSGMALVAPSLSRTPGRARERVRDQVGNAHFFNAKAPVARSGMRLLGARVPVTGSVKVLAIPVQFVQDDDPLTSGRGVFPYRTWGPASTPGYLADRLNKVKAYYSEVSGGRVTMSFTLYPAVTLSKKMATYVDNINGSDPLKIYSILSDTVNTIDATVNFAQYDIVMLIHAGSGAEIYEDDTEMKDFHSLYMTGASVPTNDGVSVDSFALVPETECNDTVFADANPGINIQDYEVDPASVTTEIKLPHAWDVVGVWAHELGHAFGLPDMYDTSYSSGVGLYNWSLMADGSYLPAPPPGDIIDTTPAAYGSVPCHIDAYCRL